MSNYFSFSHISKEKVIWSVKVPRVQKSGFRIMSVRLRNVSEPKCVAQFYQFGMWSYFSTFSNFIFIFSIVKFWGGPHFKKQNISIFSYSVLTILNKFCSGVAFIASTKRIGRYLSEKFRLYGKKLTALLRKISKIGLLMSVKF